MTKVYSKNTNKSIMLNTWPNIINLEFDNDENNHFNTFRELVSKIRNVKGTFNVEKQVNISLALISNDTKLKDYISHVFPYIQKLTAVSEIIYTEPKCKCIVENVSRSQVGQPTFTDVVLHFPVTKDYKMDGMIKAIHRRIQECNTKINKLKDNIAKCSSPKKIKNFEEAIEKVLNTDIPELHEKIQYYENLIK